MSYIPRQTPATLLRGGSIIGDEGFLRVDVLVEQGRVVAVGPKLDVDDDVQTTDCGERVILPGAVDAHSHAGSRIFDEDVQQTLLRQGVTTIVVGQDGVGPAPGNGLWAGRYFAAIDGPHPTYRGGGIAALLATYDGTTPLNVAALVPAGTVRHEVVGDEARAASVEELRAMRALVRQGLDDGAVGLATGLDYVPGLFADEAELAELCSEVAAADGLYVSHVRGGYEANIGVGVDEVVAIVRSSGVRAHVSHLHAPVATALKVLDEAATDGVPLTFDSYPYSRGCTILSMLLLPAALARPGSEDLARAVATEAGRQHVHAAIHDRVLTRADLGPHWADQITLSHVPSPEHLQLQGQTLTEAAIAVNATPIDLAIDLLVASALQTTAIMRVPHPRTPQQLAPLFRHPGHTAGSDGIYVGGHPHPRAAGTMARYLEDFVGAGLLSWPAAQRHLSTTAVERFRLGARGSVRVGAVADLAVVDPDRVAAQATYEHPLQDAVGIDDVLVAGVAVLAHGHLTGATPGSGLRRAPGPSS